MLKDGKEFTKLQYKTSVEISGLTIEFLDKVGLDVGMGGVGVDVGVWRGCGYDGWVRVRVRMQWVRVGVGD